MEDIRGSIKAITNKGKYSLLEVTTPNGIQRVGAWDQWHDVLDSGIYKVGDSVNVTFKLSKDGKYKNVVSIMKAELSEVQEELARDTKAPVSADGRTKDIHWQVCLKIGVEACKWNAELDKTRITSQDVINFARQLHEDAWPDE